MGFGDEIFNKASELSKKLLNFGGDAGPIEAPNNSLTGEYKAVCTNNSEKKITAQVDGRDWYKIFGYQFVVKKGQDSFYFTLPIPPSTMLVNQIIPNKATPSLGGMVEEVSPIKKWGISLEGTTGTAIARAAGDEVARQKMCQVFRSAITTTGLLDGVMAQAQAALNKGLGILDNVIDSASDAYNAANNGDIMGAVSAGMGGVKGTIDSVITPPLPYAASAVPSDTNGFIEALELQKFIYMYQHLKSRQPKNYELYFKVQKTGQKWRVIVRDFSLRRSAESPNLWRYTLSMVGWDISPSDDDNSTREEIDRFKTDLKPVNVIDNNMMLDKLSKFESNLRKVSWG